MSQSQCPKALVLLLGLLIFLSQLAFGIPASLHNDGSEIILTLRGCGPAQNDEIIYIVVDNGHTPHLIIHCNALAITLKISWADLRPYGSALST